MSRSDLVLPDIWEEHDPEVNYSVQIKFITSTNQFYYYAIQLK